MKKILLFALAILLFTGCAAQRSAIKVGNVTISDNKGQIVSSYQRVQILNQVGEGDNVTNIKFVERDGTVHYVEDGCISVDGIEYIEEGRSSNRVVVVGSYPYYSYPYVITYPYRSYYHPYYNRRPLFTPRPAPRPAPGPAPRPAPGGGQPRPGGGPRR